MATLLLTIETAGGIPANPNPLILTQPDNSTFQARLFGDEEGAYFQTLDGYTILKNESGWWSYAKKENNNLIPPEYIVSTVSPKQIKVQQFQNPSVEKFELHPEVKVKSLSDSLKSSVHTSSAIGTKKALVILINFTDVPNLCLPPPGVCSTPSHFEDLLFNSSDGVNSMTNYFEEVSYGKLNITGSIAGSRWFTASYNLSWYGKDGNTSLDLNQSQLDLNQSQLVTEAIKAADPYVNYRDFDTNNDGIVDNLIIVHAGNDQADSGNPNDIWSKYAFGLDIVTDDGVKVNSYTMQAENSPVGTFAHEFGHALGLPDLYNIDTPPCVKGKGVGYWDIMAYGAWLNSGNTPSHLSAWSKYFLGWVNPTKVNNTLLNKTINQSETNDDFYIFLDKPDYSSNKYINSEFFLIENRRKVGYDAYLPGEGLLIWHINHSVAFELEEADANDYPFDSGDAWVSNVEGFNQLTKPNSNLYDGTPSGVGIQNISQSATVMNADLIVGLFFPPRVHNLNTDKNYYAIQAAINDSAIGDAIKIDAGKYYENVKISKSLNITGAGMKSTILIADDGWKDVIYVSNVSYVNVSELAVKNSMGDYRAGIYLYNSSYSILKNVNASGNFYGIFFNSAKNTTLINSNISNNFRGIGLYYANNNTIFNNTVNFNSWEGILSVYSNSNTIYNNFFNNMWNLGSGASNNRWNINKTTGKNIVGGPYISGNFWANPLGSGFSQTCTDTDSDGICDSAYILQDENIDNLPLTSPPPTITITFPRKGQVVNSSKVEWQASGNLTKVNHTILKLDNNSNISYLPLSGNYTFQTTDGYHNVQAWLAYANDTGLPNPEAYSTVNFTIDTIAPNIMGIFLNNTILKPGDSFYIMVNAIDNVSKNLTVNTRIINDTNVVVVNEMLVQIGSDLYRIDGDIGEGMKEETFTLNISVSDEAGNTAHDDSQTITVDGTKPRVMNLSTYKSTHIIKEPVIITANINDTHLNISNIFVKVMSPSGYMNTSLMIDLGNETYHSNYSNTSEFGRYDITIIASDLAGNINDTEKTWFVTTMPPYINQSINTTANNVTSIDALEKANTTIELVTSNDTTGGAVSITMSNDIPPEMSQSFSFNPLGKYISINASDSIRKNLTWIKLKFYYTHAELDASGLDEASLKISWCNESSDPYKWETLSAGSPQWVNGAGVEISDINGYAGYAWANISHLSTFAIIGEHTKTSTYTPPPSSGSGSGGGGGGGGSSGENYSNIAVKEKYDLHILKDKTTSYAFTNKSNPILFVNITGNVNAGEINTAVEVLRGTSTLVKSKAPGTVYMNANIWVGSSGFAVPTNIKEAVIRFRVENSWLSGNNFAGSDIKMVRWDGSRWVTLKTAEKSRDSTYTYYEAKTDSFSSFAITGLRDAITPTATPSEANMTQAVVQAEAIAPTQTEDQTKKAAGFDILLTITTLSAVYILRSRRR